MPNEVKAARAKKISCVACAGIGERDPSKCTHKPTRGRSAIRAVWDSDGRWLIHWLEANGDEWVGTYRLIPC